MKEDFVRFGLLIVGGIKLSALRFLIWRRDWLMVIMLEQRPETVEIESFRRNMQRNGHMFPRTMAKVKEIREAN